MSDETGAIAALCSGDPISCERVSTMAASAEFVRLLSEFRLI
jgi:hypothetical protein